MVAISGHAMISRMPHSHSCITAVDGPDLHDMYLYDSDNAHFQCQDYALLIRLSSLVDYNYIMTMARARLEAFSGN